MLLISKDTTLSKVNVLLLLREAGRPPFLYICVTIPQIGTNDPAQLPLLKARQTEFLIDLLNFCGNVVDVVKTIYI